MEVAGTAVDTEAARTAIVIVDGNNGDDTLSGGKANDILNGGNDTDRCSGNTDTDSATNCEQTFSIP